MLAGALQVSPSSLRAKLHYVEHHVAHAASAFYSSPFEEAAIMTPDALGDFASMLWGAGKGQHINIDGTVLFPDSLGYYYTAVTQYLGFWKFGDEYKVMGLGSYGEPRYADVFQDMLRVGKDLDFKLNLDYFTHHRRAAFVTWENGEAQPSLLFSEHMERALGPAREPGAPVEQAHKDVAATLQWHLEEVLFTLLNQLHERTGQSNLCYAGGVAFNCAANGKIFERTPFKNVFIQPAAGDAGLAMGAAQYVQHEVLGTPRSFVMKHAYWGPEFSVDQMRAALDAAGLAYKTLDTPAISEQTAARIAEGKVVGWYQGRSEWGPRALGNRSIVGDPRRADLRDLLNSRIKHREPFRPFAPSVLEERTADWFEQSHPSPFMQLAYPVRPEKRESIPAPTHVDGTGRLQTVGRDANPEYYELISAFERETGVPVLLNTSLNENEPIVNTPQEAVDCFSRTGMDVLALGPYLVER
jgi:carbamoyltransferase